MAKKTQHYWRIHARVTRRLWSELEVSTRAIIAADTLHETETFKWFEGKVNADTERLYNDPNYYDNADYTFRIARHEDPYATA